MGILKATMEKQLIGESSNYHIRRMYLQIMKQRMTDDQTDSQSQITRDIEAYLLYEKEISRYIQDLLEHSDFSPDRN